VIAESIFADFCVLVLLLPDRSGYVPGVFCIFSSDCIGFLVFLYGSPCLVGEGELYFKR
jgi:hypothetical protein